MGNCSEPGDQPTKALVRVDAFEGFSKGKTLFLRRLKFNLKGTARERMQYTSRNRCSVTIGKGLKGSQEDS